jgi:protein gp37
MSAATRIEWTHRPGTTGVTWNPTTGCDRISAGCDHCYALSMARRLKAMGSAKYQRDGHPATSGPGFGLTVHWDALAEPARWAAPRTVFVNSMSDLFHAQVPRAFLAQVFLTMARTPQHRYLILTKRAGANGPADRRRAGRRPGAARATRP